MLNWFDNYFNSLKINIRASIFIKLGETINTSTRECEECEVDFCEACDYLEKNKCTKCESGKFLSTDKLTCGTTCLTGYQKLLIQIFLNCFKILRRSKEYIY